MLTQDEMARFYRRLISILHRNISEAQCQAQACDTRGDVQGARDERLDIEAMRHDELRLSGELAGMDRLPCYISRGAAE